MDEVGRPVGYIGFFECLPEHLGAGVEVLLAAEGLLRAQGVATVQAPRVDNNLVGLLVERFDLPQTVLTPHNPPYYADILRAAGYGLRETLRTYVFDRGSLVNLPLVRPGFRTRVFDRRNLDEEVRVFHELQFEIFSQHPGWVARSLEDDRQLIVDLLPILDDDLVIIAEDRTGYAVGLLVCLPDVYQAFRGEPIDNARAISIGVVRPLAARAWVSSWACTCRGTWPPRATGPWRPPGSGRTTFRRRTCSPGGSGADKGARSRCTRRPCEQGHGMP